jgi:hypothetical protein
MAACYEGGVSISFLIGCSDLYIIFATYVELYGVTTMWWDCNVVTSLKQILQSFETLHFKYTYCVVIFGVFASYSPVDWISRVFFMFSHQIANGCVVLQNAYLDKSKC